MAFRVYQNVPLSTVTKIIFADVNEGVYSKYTEPNHVAHIYSVLKYLPVTGFVMYDNGALVVSIMSVKELAANVIRKFWKARQLRKQGCEVSRGQRPLKRVAKAARSRRYPEFTLRGEERAPDLHRQLKKAISLIEC